MSLRRRLDRLEPELAERWEALWEAAACPPSGVYLLELAESIAAWYGALTAEEQADFDRRFVEDTTRYPALRDWDNAALEAWHDQTQSWLEAAGFDLDRPDYGLWPHQAPPPPDIPVGMKEALEAAAYDRDNEFRPLYAYALLTVLWARSFARAIAAHEAKSGETSHY